MQEGDLESGGYLMAAKKETSGGGYERYSIDVQKFLMRQEGRFKTWKC